MAEWGSASDVWSRRGPGRRGPALGCSFEGRPTGFLEAVVDHIDLVEVVPDCLVGPRGDLLRAPLDDLDRHAADLPVLYHGIGLSIGTSAGWNESYLEVLEALIAHRRPLWHSEHLGYSIVDGRFLGTMAALPTTWEAIDLVATRAAVLRDRFGLDMLFEHVATPIPRPADMSPARFLNELSRASGCGILLDLHNLECDADNGLVDLDEFWSELDTDNVREIHVAGGTWDGDFHLDVHVDRTAATTRQALDRLLPRCPNLEAVVFELLAEAVPLVGLDGIVDELVDLRAALDRSTDVTP